jgi:hypothetical protein
MKRIGFALVLLFAISVSLISASTLNFEDLGTHWASEIIAESEFAHVLSENDSFQPNKAISRIDFARMLHSALNITINYFRAPDIQETFSDITNEDKGASALIDLVTTGIVDDKDVFRPNDPLRRDEMIHYVINALKYQTNGNYALIKMMPAPFDDEDLLIADYKNDVVEAVLLGIIKGRGDNMLYPAAASTRAEAVVLVSRLLAVAKRLADVDVAVEAVLDDNSIEMKLTIKNNTDRAVTINHTSGQHFDFQLLDEDLNVLYTWSADKMFIMALTETVIEPGDYAEYSAILDGDFYSSIKDRIYILRGCIVGTSESFEVNESGYDYYID